MTKTFVLLALLAPAIASAEAPPKPPTTVKLPPQAAEHAQTAQVLYFNRCLGGCTVTKSTQDDVRLRATTIPNGPIGSQYTLTEFRHGDAVWNDIMQCLREVYSPYNVMITDVPPAPGVAYNENIIAGSDNEINYSAGGVSPVTADCSPFSYAISYTFANDYGPDAYQLCYVAAQETGHAFGMADHSYSFISDGRSACTDPMSYRTDCLSRGQRFFRNESANCGDFKQSPCNCAGMNSHLKLISALGAGQSIIPPPLLAVNAPATGATIQSGAAVLATASSKRGIAKVELWLNGYKWAEVKGAPFGAASQPSFQYSLAIPNEVPNSILDIEVIAKDDIGAATASTLTVTKGAPCADASTCLAGQKCEAGKCFWDPAVGEVGDVCTYPQYCVSGICLGATGDEEMRCTQTCIPGVADSCPMDFECIAASATSGACWPKDEKTGCCSTGREAAAQTGLLALGLVLVLRRRRRPAAR